MNSDILKMAKSLINIGGHEACDFAQEFIQENYDEIYKLGKAGEPYEFSFSGDELVFFMQIDNNPEPTQIRVKLTDDFKISAIAFNNFIDVKYFKNDADMDSLYVDILDRVASLLTILTEAYYEYIMNNLI